MVKAILDGRKSQTRRVVKPQPDHGVIRKCPGDEVTFANFEMDIRPGVGWIPIGKSFTSPYQVGDRLWVKETWQIDEEGHVIIYKADEGSENTKIFIFGGYHWRPSIFMPKQYTRLWLEVTAVRAERLNSITEEDAKTEGCTIDRLPDGSYSTAIEHFRDLWDSIHGEEASWESNCFVWRYTFELAP